MTANVNADPAELAKFDALASRWWDPEGEFRPLHAMNPVRLTYIERVCGGLAGKKILDVGCGGGILSESLAAHGATVTGIDLAEAPLAVARLHLHESGLAVDYRQQSAEALAAEQPATFDIITCMEMLEHVPDPAAIVQACAALLKPGGHLVCSTLSRTPKAWLLAIVGAEYVLGLLPRGTHDYTKFIRPAELDTWLRSAGLETRDATGLHYNPLTRQFRLAPGVDVNYLLHAHKPA